MSIKIEAPSETTRDAGGLSKDDEDFIAELRENSLLKKADEYVAMNAELEKKTSNILSEIEKYSASRSSSKLTVDSHPCPIVEDETGFSGGDHQGGPTKGCSNNYWMCHPPKDLDYVKDGMEVPEEQFGSRRARSSSSTGSFLSAKTSSTSIKSVRSLHGSEAGDFECIVDESVGPALNDLDRTSDTGKRQSTASRFHKARDSVVSSLQSQLMNYEARIKELHVQHRQKLQENTILETKIKALEDDRERLLKSVTSLQSSLDKQITQLDACKNKASTKTQIVESLRKEIDLLKRDQKQMNSQNQSLQTRLNRSLEENDKLRCQIKALNGHIREVQAEARGKSEVQQQRIVTLEQERILLGSTVAKQSHLLKNLSQQKVILENIVGRTDPQIIAAKPNPAHEG